MIWFWNIYALLCVFSELQKILFFPKCVLPATRNAECKILKFIICEFFILHSASRNVECRMQKHFLRVELVIPQPASHNCRVWDAGSNLLYDFFYVSPQPATLNADCNNLFSLLNFYPATRKLWITGCSLIYDWVVCFRISQLWIAEKLVRL